MASKQIYSAVVLYLIFSQVISTTTADFDDTYNSDSYTSGGYCSGSPSSSLNLGDGCSMSDDCSTVTCNMNFADQQITFKLEVNKCDDPVSATASMNVPDLGITWSHTYTSNDIVAVPGFTVSLPSIFSAGVYVQVDLSDDGSNINMKVKLLAGGEIAGQSAYPIKVTVLDGDLPISTDDCGIFGWWLDLSDFLKAAVIIGPIIFLVIIITCCCCCCGCCGNCCRSSPSTAGPVIVTPGAPAVMATNVKSTVPMRRLVEEA